MTYVAINVLSVPEGAGAAIEQRFAGRAGMVEDAPGFLRFELLRPVAGTTDYLVVTHWQAQEHFTAWRQSQAFAKGHAQAGVGSEAPPAAPASTLWAYQVVQSA